VSLFVSLECGVRQGGVLSLIVQYMYMDDVIKVISNSKYCCNLRFTCVSIFVYADNLILMSPSVTVLQKLFNCRRGTNDLRNDTKCANIIAHDGSAIL